jgi:hypothetical protein
MRSIRFVAVLLGTVSLAACLNSTTLVKLKPDGSGTVEQTTLVNMAALKSMMPGAEKQATEGLVNKADLERTAQRMGKGVRLLSAEPVTAENGFAGSKAIFAFDDINQIQVSQGPNMSGSTDGKFSSEPTANDPVRFNFTRGAGGSTLSINFVDRPRTGKSDGNATPSTPPDIDFSNPMMMNMVKTMFQGFKVNIALDVQGTITKTNAEYVDGSRITLLEMDMNALLADEAALKELTGKLRPDASFSEVKPLLKNIKGIKIDGPSITVQFK